MRRRWLAALAGLAAVPLPAAAQSMCAALARIEAASREPVPFASLKDGSELVPGYRWCRVVTGTERRAGQVLCHTNMAPRSLLSGVVGAQVRDCLGAVPVPRGRFSSGEDYRTDRLSISVSSHCDERCHVGRLASFSVRIRRPEEEGDGDTPTG